MLNLHTPLSLKEALEFEALRQQVSIPRESCAAK